MPKLIGSTLSLRAATEADMQFLLELWRNAMSPHFAVSGISTSEENPLRRLLMRFECAAIVLLEGQPAGLFKVARDGTDWKLVQILLSPTVQRKGIGAHLIRKLITEAKTAGASLGLSVLKQNPARELYLRLGFVIIGEETHAYEMRLG